MSRAKELAKEYAENVMLCVDHRSDVYEAYYEGYQQAEKDNELTWNDVRDILNLYEDVIEMDFCKDIYGEVLKRFKDLKKNERPV
jgi:hypothetical protein